MDAKQLKQRTRQIRIKSGSCKRLTKDLQLYIEEKRQNMEKLAEVKAAGADKHEIKKHTELLEETCAVLISTFGKVKDAYTSLDQILLSGKETQEIVDSDEFQEGLRQLQATHDLMNSKKKKTPTASNDVKAIPLDKLKTVSVFGSSTAKPEDASYKAAFDLGGRLAKANYNIMSGGYNGTMEALSKGAAEAKGSKAIAGVLVPTVFPNRKNGNDFLTLKIEETSIEKRLATLVGGGSAFIVLPGSLGTLTELIMAWNTAVLAPLSGKKPPPIIAFREPWEAVIKGIQGSLKVPQMMLDMIQYVSSAEEAMKLLQQ